MLSGNLLWVLTGTMLLGIAAGITGTFSFLQKQSLVGDAAAHAALPGIALAFLLTGQKELPILMVGAAITSALSVYSIQWIVTYSKLKADAAIGLVLAVFFGVGIVLLTIVNRSPLGNQSGLNDFIFGKAASISGERLRIQTGLPRHSTRFIVPGWMSEMSTSTGAPAALARATAASISATTMSR